MLNKSAVGIFGAMSILTMIGLASNGCAISVYPFVEYDCVAHVDIPVRGGSACTVPGTNQMYPETDSVEINVEVVERGCPDGAETCPGRVAACSWVLDAVRKKAPSGLIPRCEPDRCAQILGPVGLTSPLGVIGNPLNWPNPVDYANKGQRFFTLSDDAGPVIEFTDGGPVADASIGPDTCDPNAAPLDTSACMNALTQLQQNQQSGNPIQVNMCGACFVENCCQEFVNVVDRDGTAPTAADLLDKAQIVKELDCYAELGDICPDTQVNPAVQPFTQCMNVKCLSPACSM